MAADFGIIQLQADGDIVSYDPPLALVEEEGRYQSREYPWMRKEEEEGVRLRENP